MYEIGGFPLVSMDGKKIGRDADENQKSGAGGHILTDRRDRSRDMVVCQKTKSGIVTVFTG
jgi:hypothetical protein